MFADCGNLTWTGNIKGLTITEMKQETRDILGEVHRLHRIHPWTENLSNKRQKQDANYNYNSLTGH